MSTAELDRVVTTEWRAGTDTLPPPLRPRASLGVLDITEWFGDTSGGIRTYLMQKSAYVRERPELRQIIVVPGAHDRIEESAGVRMYRLHGPRIPGQPPYRFMLATRSVARIARHEHPQLIEIGSPFIVPWIVRFATRQHDVPLVSFYHSNVPRLFAPRTDNPGMMRRAVHSGARAYVRRLDRLFARTIVTSQYTADDLAREGIDRVSRVPLGVDLRQFHPHRRGHATETRQRFGLPEGPLAAFLGRFAAEKELTVVLDAWPAIERRTGARLALIGAGPLEDTLRAHPYGPRVCFLPFQRQRDTVADLLAAVDVYLAPSRVETFGLSSLESLASATPVLSANDGGVAEQVRNSGAGRLFDAGNSDSFAEEAIALFGADLDELGEAGRRFAEAEHSWDAVLGRLFDVYRDVIAGR